MNEVSFRAGPDSMNSYRSYGIHFRFNLLNKLCVRLRKSGSISREGRKRGRMRASQSSHGRGENGSMGREPEPECLEVNGGRVVRSVEKDVSVVG